MSRLLHLDPSLPVVWRSPTSFQIGVDSPVALVESVDQRHVPVLAALHSGIHVEGVEAIASHEGLEPGEIAHFLDRLSAAADARAPDPLPLIRITGSTSHLHSFARVLLELGYRESRAAEEAVLVSSFVMSPTAYHPWLADDIPHTHRSSWVTKPSPSDHASRRDEDPACTVSGTTPCSATQRG